MANANMIQNVLIAAGITTTATLATLPEVAIQLWEAVPDVFKAMIPEEFLPLITGSLTFFAVVVRFYLSFKAKRDAAKVEVKPEVDVLAEAEAKAKAESNV